MFNDFINAHFSSYSNDVVTMEQLHAIIDHTPLCVNLINDKYERVYCNEFAVNLFGFSDKQQYLNSIYKMIPDNQPDGSDSFVVYKNSLDQVAKKGFFKLFWLFKDLNGKDLPAEVYLYRIEINDSKSDFYIVSYLKDIRSELAGYEDRNLSDGFFYNSISDRNLFNTVAELSDEWFWALDIKSKMIQFFGKGRSILKLSAEKQPFPKEVLEAGMVYEPDIPVFLEMADAMYSGDTRPFDVRFNLHEGGHRYFRVVFKTTYDSNGVALFSIGKTFDIHDQKTFETMSRTDLLTKCLNKISTEEAIKEATSQYSNKKHALFIVDIDNFKAVNDNLGHHFGDLVLSEIAENLHSSFRDDDIIGRIGGDEFIIFLTDVDSSKLINSKAESISKAFQNTFSGENDDYKISGSIGISIYPEHGTDYDELYKSADKALYQSKLKGKDCYTVYTEDLADGTMKNLTVVDNANRIASSYFDSYLISTIFDSMYESHDAHTAINSVLQLMGNRLHADRCYFVEAKNSGSSYEMTFEWCKGDVKKELASFKNIDTDTLKPLFLELNKTDVIYSNDTSQIEQDDTYWMFKNQGIKSFLLAQSRGKKHSHIILGIEDCREPRIFSEKEINSVRYALRMISLFLQSNETKRCNLVDNDLNIELSDDEKALLKKLGEKGIEFYRC